MCYSNTGCNMHFTNKLGRLLRNKSTHPGTQIWSSDFPDAPEVNSCVYAFDVRVVMKRNYSDIMEKVYVTYILWVYFLYTTDFKSFCDIKNNTTKYF